MNKVMLLGRVGADPELRTTSGGMSIMTIRFATSEKRKKDGERHEVTEWHRLKLFGKQAEGLMPHIKKGDMAAVVGKIHYDEYEKDGVKMYFTEILVDEWHFAGGSKKQDPAEREYPASWG